MGKSKSLELPAPPTYKQPELGMSNNNLLSDYGKQLSSGDFTGNLSWLNPTINSNNTSLALAAAQGTLQPQFRDTLTQIRNEAAANGQLESSTFTDALARSQSDLNSQYQTIVSQQAINDSNLSGQNRLHLFGKGLDTLQQTIGNDVTFAGNENQFNLNNYSNLVAQAIQNNQNANKANGWQQVLGMVSPIGNDYLKSTGVNSVPGYGVADIAKIGSLFMGGGGLGNVNGINGQINPFQGGSAPGAGAYASNGLADPWRGITTNPNTGLYSYTRN
jgi:hypothetical protein